jgi:hypothetical protein
MKWWPWPALTRGDVAGISFAIILAIIVIFASIFGPEISRRINYGFGPEWDCFNPGKLAGLSCIKHPVKAANPN